MRQALTYTLSIAADRREKGQEDGPGMIVAVALGRNGLPGLLKVETASELLGISRSAAYRAAAAGELPTLRFGRRLYVPTARLLDLLGIGPEGTQR
jgi:excisionase family DNA binding protein